VGDSKLKAYKTPTYSLGKFIESQKGVEMAKWHVSGVERVRMGVLVEADSADEAREKAEEIDMDKWTDGGDYDFEIDFVEPWLEN